VHSFGRQYFVAAVCFTGDGLCGLVWRKSFVACRLHDLRDLVELVKTEDQWLVPQVWTQHKSLIKPIVVRLSSRSPAGNYPTMGFPILTRL